MSEPTPDPIPEPATSTGGCDEPDCTEAVAELYTYIDGHLDDERRSLIQGHLDSCGPCFDAFDFESELRKVIATKCREQVPDDLRKRIEEALGREA